MFTFKLFQGKNITDFQILGLTFFATPSFFRHEKRLRRIEHLQDQGFISSELYFTMYLVVSLVRAALSQTIAKSYFYFMKNKVH